MSDLAQARADLEAAEAAVKKAGKEELGATLSGIFDDPEIRDISWGMKYGEYDDEGLYPGIMGPVVNQFMSEDGDLDWSDWWEALFDRNNQNASGKTKAVDALKTVLDDIGPEFLVDILNTYDEQIVIVYRNESESAGFSIITESAGY